MSGCGTDGSKAPSCTSGSISDDLSWLDELTLLMKPDIGTAYRKFGDEVLLTVEKLCNVGKKSSRIRSKALANFALPASRPSDLFAKSMRASETFSVTVDDRDGNLDSNITVTEETSTPPSSIARGRPTRRAKQRIQDYTLPKLNKKARRPTNFNRFGSVTTIFTPIAEQSEDESGPPCNSDCDLDGVFKKPLQRPKRAKNNATYIASNSTSESTSKTKTSTHTASKSIAAPSTDTAASSIDTAASSIDTAAPSTDTAALPNSPTNMDVPAPDVEMMEATLPGSSFTSSATFTTVPDSSVPPSSSTSDNKSITRHSKSPDVNLPVASSKLTPDDSKAEKYVPNTRTKVLKPKDDSVMNTDVEVLPRRSRSRELKLTINSSTVSNELVSNDSEQQTYEPKTRTKVIKAKDRSVTNIQVEPVESIQLDIKVESPSDKENSQNTPSRSKRSRGSGSQNSRSGEEKELSSEAPSKRVRSSAGDSPLPAESPSPPKALNQTQVLVPKKNQSENQIFPPAPLKPKRSKSSDPALLDVPAGLGRATRSKMKLVESERQARTISCDRSALPSGSDQKNLTALLKDLTGGSTKPRTPKAGNTLFSPLGRKIVIKATKLPIASTNKDSEAAKKKQEIMKLKAEEARKQREQKTEKVAQSRAAAEEQRLRLLEKEKKERERKEKELKAQLQREKEQKLIEKRLLHIQKAKEVEERRLKEEQLRLAKLKEAEEEKRRAEEARVKQMDEAERLAALRKAQAKEESARLLKEQLKKAALKTTVGTSADDIGIHDNDQEEAEDSSAPPRVARWAKDVERFTSLLKKQIALSADAQNYFGPVRATPDINAMFGASVKYRQRTSSANWDSPLKLPLKF